MVHFKRSILIVVVILAVSQLSTASAGTIKRIDDFAKNYGGWWERNHGDDVTAVINDGYTFDRKATAGSWWIWNGHRFIPDQWADFQISATVRSLEVHNSGFGIVWNQGTTNFKAHNSFMISGGGSYIIEEHLPEEYNVTVAWTPVPAVKKGAVRNDLTVKKQGNWIHYLINGQEVKKIHFRPLFGDAIGFQVTGKKKFSVENLEVIAHDPAIPEDWTVENRGNLYSRFVWQDVNTNRVFKAELQKEADLKLMMTDRSAPFVSIRATVNGPIEDQDNPQAVCGLFIQTDDNAMLRLERVVKDNQPMIRFATSSAGKLQGKKEVDVQSGPLTLDLSRVGDVFTGKIMVGGAEKKIGSLKWPGLSRKVEAGLFTEYKNVPASGPQKLTIEITDYAIGLGGQG